MAAQVGALYVQLTMDSRPYTAGMARAESVTARAARTIERDVGVAHRSITGLTGAAGSRSFRPHALMAVSRSFENAADRSILLRSSLLSLTAVAGGFTAALSSNLLARYADTFTQLTNQIRTVTDSSVELGAVQNALAGVAERSRSGLQATATLYARTARATEHLGTSQQDLLRITETVQKAFSIGGASAAEAAGAAIQLSQGIASDRFSGEEFRSVAENAPVLLRGMAESLGVTIGKLREMAHAGELTAEVVTKAILQSGARIEQEFGETAITIDRALGQVDNQLITYIGNADRAHGISTLLAQGILAFGNNLDQIIPTITLAAAAIGTLMVARNKMLLGGSLGALAGGAAGFGLGGIPGMVLGGGLGGLMGGQAGDKGTGFIAQIKNEAKEARDRIVALRQEQERLKSENLAARKAGYAARNAAEMDRLASASGALQKQYARDAAQIEKLDMRKLAIQEEVRNSYARIAQVNASLSPRNVRLAEAQMEAERKLQDTLRQRRDIQRTLTQVTTRETAALGMQSTFVGKLRTLTEATKARAEVNAQLAANEKQAFNDRIALANREMQINKEADADSRRMMNERMVIQRKLNSLLEEQNAIDQKRTTSVGVARGSRAEAEVDGQRRLTEQITQTRLALQASNVAIADNEKQLASATRSASGFGMALGLAGRGAGALLGALGGPAGIAIMATVGVLGYLAQKANESRVQTESLKSELRGLGLLAEDASTGVDGLNKSLDELADDELRSKLREVAAELDRIRGEQNPFAKVFSYDKDSLGNMLTELNNLRVGLSGQGIPILGRYDIEGVRAIAPALEDIITRARDGKINAEQLNLELNALAASNPDMDAGIDSLIGRLREAAPFIDALNQRAVALQTELQLGGVEAKWERLIQQQRDYAAAMASTANFAAAMEQLKADASRSEEDQRVLDTTDSIIKAWEAINEEKGISVEVSRTLAEERARELIAIEDAAAAAKAKAEEEKKNAEELATFMSEIDRIQSALASREVSVIDGDASRRVQELVTRFEEGRIGAEEVKTELQAIAGMDISGGMRGLINNIIAAMGPLQGLLDMFGRLPGFSSGGSGERALPGPATSRGALGRSRRALAEAKEITTAYAEEQVRLSGLSAKQADLETKISTLIADTPATGVPLSREQAELVATRMQQAEAEVAAAEEARRKAEGGGGGSESSYDRAIGSIREKAAALQLEASMQGMSTAAIEKAKLIQELETAAKEDSIGLTPERIATIQAEANAYSALVAAADAAKKKQEELEESMNFYKDTFRGFFQEIGASLRNGEDFWTSFANAALNALGKIADRMLGMAADGIFDMLAKAFVGGISSGLSGGFSSSITGSSGGFFPGITGPRLAAGGPVVGSGTGVSDSIIARLSNGEFVVNARSARAFRPLLEAINDNRPGFAAGGWVAPSMPANNNLGSFAKAISRGSETNGSGNVFHIDARGAQRGVGEEIRTALEQYDRGLPDRLNQIRADPRKRK